MPQRKMALFVEGQTESIFSKKLLKEIAGEKNITFKETNNVNNTSLSSLNDDEGFKYFVLIVDCHNDESVKTRILENRERLISSGYELVIGLRDVYPIPRENIEKLEQGLRTRVPTKGIRIEFCLALMEVEAWFLQEHTHYQKVDKKLTNDVIANQSGFDPRMHCAEDVSHPAELLNNIYQIAGKSYKKKKSQVQRTVNSLDYVELYSVLPDKLEYLNRFITHVDGFIE